MQKIGVQIVFISLSLAPIFLGISFGMKEGEPDFVFNRVGNTVLMRDYTKGNVERREICFDQTTCETDKVLYYGDAVKDSFMLLKNYKTGGTYTVSITNYLGKHEEEKSQRLYFIKPAIDTTKKQFFSGIHLLAIPEGNITKSQISFSLSKNDQHKIALYIQDVEEEPFKNGFLDMDTSIDSDQDGIFDNDQDIFFNQPVLWQYDENLGEVFGKMYFERKGKKYQKNLIFSFEEKVQSPEYNALYDTISQLSSMVSPTDDYRQEFKRNLDLLRRNLGNPEKTIPLLQTCVENVELQRVLLTKSQQTLLDEIFDQLASEEMLKEKAKKNYEIAKKQLLESLSLDLGLEFKGEISFFEETVGEMEKGEKQDELLKLFLSLKNELQKEKNYQENLEPILISTFCHFFSFYEVDIQNCNGEIIETLIQQQKEEDKKLHEEQENSDIPLQEQKILFRLKDEAPKGKETEVKEENKTTMIEGEGSVQESPYSSEIQGFLRVLQKIILPLELGMGLGCLWIFYKSRKSCE